MKFLAGPTLRVLAASVLGYGALVACSGGGGTAAPGPSPVAPVSSSPAPSPSSIASHTPTPEPSSTMAATSTPAPSPTAIGSATPVATSTPTGSTPILNIVSVTPNESSVKVRVSPYHGALDYRIYNITKRASLKYAGMLNTYDGYGNHLNTSVNTELEANGLDPGETATYVVEAVDSLGPIGPAESTLLSHYDTYDPGASSFALGAFTMPMPAPGANEQPTADGNTSTNGQGTLSSTPHVLARSKPFSVTALTTPALPTKDASQVFFDTFPNSEGATIQRTSVDASAHSGGPNGAFANGNETFSMGNWQIKYGSADILNSYPFVMSHHFMDVLFDGGTPGSNSPPGEAWSWMSLTPNPPANFSNAILHATMEVDCDQHGRRFMSFGFEPHGYPIVSYSGIDAGEPNNLNVDASGNPVNLGVDVAFGPGTVGMTQAIGGTHTDGSNPPDGKIFPNTQQIIGNPSSNNPLIDNPQSQQAHGIDDRCREDVFLADTKPITEYALYQDGKSVISNGAASSTLSPLSIALPWSSSVDVHFYHVMYHTNLEHQEIAEYTPWYTFWENTVQDSDERHWNNMGFEVLPMSELSNLAAHAQPVKPQAPTYPAAIVRKLREGEL
jgi:hypothetical protein